MRLNKGSTNTAQPQYPMLTQYFLEKMRERKRKWAFFQLCHSPVSSLSLGLEFGKAFDLFIRIYNFCIIFSSRSLLFVLCIVNLAWFVKIQVGFCFMWSGFDLIGLGYVYLQPWFDFFLVIIRGLNVMTFGVICCTVIVLILILVLASDFVLLLCLWFCGNLIVKI